MRTSERMKSVIVSRYRSAIVCEVKCNMEKSICQGKEGKPCLYHVQKDESCY